MLVLVLVDVEEEVDVVVVELLVLVDVVDVRSAPFWVDPNLLETAPKVLENTAFWASNKYSLPFKNLEDFLCTPEKISIA